jgi:hypothetical protein
MRVNSRRLVQAVVLIAIAGLAGYWCLGNLSESSRFGTLAIRLPDGSAAYVVRESWGLHTDQIAVSQNPDGCVPADPQHDYIDSDAHTLIFSQADGHLTLYESAPPYGFHRPLQPWRGISVRVSTALDPSWGDLHSDPKKYGVVVLEVPLNEFCWSHLLRPVSSLRPTH